MFLPAVCVNRMDHLTSYVQEVTDSTQKLCGLIRSTYMENFNSKTGECVCHNASFSHLSFDLSSFAYPILPTSDRKCCKLVIGYHNQVAFF